MSNKLITEFKTFIEKEFAIWDKNYKTYDSIECRKEAQHKRWYLLWLKEQSVYLNLIASLDKPETYTPEEVSSLISLVNTPEAVDKEDVCKNKDKHIGCQPIVGIGTYTKCNDCGNEWVVVEEKKPEKLCETNDEALGSGQVGNYVCKRCNKTMKSQAQLCVVEEKKPVKQTYKLSDMWVLWTRTARGVNIVKSCLIPTLEDAKNMACNDAVAITRADAQEFFEGENLEREDS